MRVHLAALEGEAAVYDDSNGEAFAALAGDRYRDGGDGPEVVEVAPGVWFPLAAGWAVLVPDGQERAVILSPAWWQARTGEAA